MPDYNARDLPYMVPSPRQTSRLNPAPNQISAGYDGSLSGDNIYVAGDLGIVNTSGNFTKLVQTTPANIAGVILLEHNHAQAKAKGNFTNHLYGSIIPADEEWMFTYQGNASNGADYTMVSGDVADFREGTKYELVFNSTEKVMTVRNTTTNPTVVVVGYQGAVGYKNPRVIVRWLPGKLRGA